MHGILLIDKPAGITSHDVVRVVRRIYKTRKVGHAGTLDPLATGVLVVAVGDGTKILQFLVSDCKSYRASFKLGITTDTLDADGSVIEERPLPVGCQNQLEKVCSCFRGKIQQIPPMYSALKLNGIPLYKIARKGEQVDREPRQVTISRLEIVGQSLPEVSIEVDCSKGTYIRSLISDIGEALGCGAHLTALIRLRSGHFQLADCVSIEQMKKDTIGAGLITLDQALAHLPKVDVAENAGEALLCGVPPEMIHTSGAGELPEGSMVRLQILGQLTAIARFAPGRII